MFISIYKSVVSFFRPSFILMYSAVREIVLDKSMLVVDIFLATAIPFITQWLIWSYIYTEQGYNDIKGYTYQSLMFYYAYSIAFWRFNNSYTVVEYFSSGIESGEIETRLIWPIPLPIQRFWDFMGGLVIYIWPIIIIGIFHLTVFDATGSQTNLWEMGIMYHIGVIVQLFIASQVLCYLIGFIFATTAFWLVRTGFALQILAIFQSILGGIIFPPSFWPPYIQPLMLYNPFRYIISMPAQLLTAPNRQDLVQALLVTTAYILIFTALGTFSWKISRKKYNSVGG